MTGHRYDATRAGDVTVDDHEWLAGQFEAHRTHLRAVSYRMLGSVHEADDAVQEAWLRLSRSDAAAIDNLGGWLTTVVARVCLDMLRSRTARREEPVGMSVSSPGAGAQGIAGDPEREAVLADSVGIALLVVLETLSPAERLAFVLHDLFAVPFEEIAPLVDRSPAAARQLASRARRRVQSSDAAAPEADLALQRAVVAAFLAASREGNFEALLALLDPDVVCRADTAAVRAGATAEVRGPLDVAGTFSGRAHAARLALVDGSVGAAWVAGGRPRVAFGFTVVDGRVAAIELIADPERLARLDLTIIEGT